MVSDVIIEPQPSGIAATTAHQLARITYRQLDHWARQGWVRPSVDPGEGRSGKRLYSAGDVERMCLLRHLAKSRVNMTVAGPLVADFGVPAGDVLVQWGPVGDHEAGLRIVPASELRGQASAEGAWVTFDPAEIRSRLAEGPTALSVTEHPRRTA
jgi:hypothetical protein